MRYRLTLPCTMAVGCLLITLFDSPVPAATLEFKITNTAPAGGFAFSPVWLGIHDGSFDAFNTGAAASAAIEAIAELGNTAPITADFAGVGPQTTLPSPGGPYVPGATASTTIDVANPTSNRYLSFGAMVVPSNDFFMGNDDPLGIELFDAGGNFNGPLTVTVLGGNVWDAGTEVNDKTNGIAFIMGSDATMGADENGVITLALPGANTFLSTLLGETTAGGYTLSELLTSGGSIATIEITEVPEPSTLALAGVGVLLLMCRRRRRQQAAG